MSINRRGFLTGLVALVAAPAIIRVAPLMPISTRFEPAYVPIDWLKLKYGMEPFPLDEVCLPRTGIESFLKSLKAHGWSRPMADNWVDLNNYDPGYIKLQLQAEAESDEDSLFAPLPRPEKFWKNHPREWELPDERAPATRTSQDPISV